MVFQSLCFQGSSSVSEAPTPRSQMGPTSQPSVDVPSSSDWSACSGVLRVTSSITIVATYARSQTRAQYPLQALQTEDQCRKRAEPPFKPGHHVSMTDRSSADARIRCFPRIYSHGTYATVISRRRTNGDHCRGIEPQFPEQRPPESLARIPTKCPDLYDGQRLQFA